MQYFAGFFMFLPIGLSAVSIALLLISLRLHRTNLDTWTSLLASFAMMVLQSMEVNANVSISSATDNGLDMAWSVLHALVLTVFILGACRRRTGDG